MMTLSTRLKLNDKIVEINVEMWKWEKVKKESSWRLLIWYYILVLQSPQQQKIKIKIN